VKIFRVHKDLSSPKTRQPTAVRTFLFFVHLTTLSIFQITAMRRLTTGILSEKCVVRRFRHCAKVIECTYTKLDSILNLIL